jgi:hypothetical protein
MTSRTTGEKHKLVFFNLNELSDEEIFSLKEYISADDINAHRYDLEKIAEFENELTAKDFFTYMRIILIKGHRYEEADEPQKALSQLMDFLEAYEHFFSKFNPLIMNRFAVSIYRLIGDIFHEHENDGTSASDYYLRIKEIQSIKESNPFVILVAASRIVKGAWLRYQRSRLDSYFKTLIYGTDLFAYAVQQAFVVNSSNYVSFNSSESTCYLQKPHFFREIFREAKIISDVFDEIYEELEIDIVLPAGPPTDQV